MGRKALDCKLKRPCPPGHSLLSILERFVALYTITHLLCDFKNELKFPKNLNVSFLFIVVEY